MSDTTTPSPVITRYPDAPLPTRRTLSNRKNLLVQVPKFFIMNGNIIMMVLKGHEKD